MPNKTQEEMREERIKEKLKELFKMIDVKTGYVSFELRDLYDLLSQEIHRAVEGENKRYLETNIVALIKEMEKDAEEYGQYHDNDCPMMREGGADFGDECECEQILAFKSFGREWMGKVNQWWVNHAEAHRAFCSPEGNKMLTKMMGKKNRPTSSQGEEESKGVDN